MANTEWKIFRLMPKLDESEKAVILGAVTEAPGTGRYVDFWEDGLYLCRQCGLPLYRSDDKFRCSCDWPSFDDSLPEAVVRRPDPDGLRTEIICSNCSAHLGHVFEGENLTPKNSRHCVNSLAISFVKTEEAIFAGGCFWGVEDLMSHTEGVVSAVSGYTGGVTPNPTYREVCGNLTGHAEAVLVDFEPSIVSYRDLARKFFEIHDATQLDRQGPDIGTQYRSAIFYFNDYQRETALDTIEYLRACGENIVTELKPAGVFYPAEDYHQKYFEKNPEKHCHTCHFHVPMDWEKNVRK